MGKSWVGLLLVLVSGCGGGSLLGAEDAPSFSSSANIQAALNDAGLTTGYEAVASADRDMYEQRAADVGKCEIDGEVPKLLIFKDKGQMDNWAGMVKQLGCTMGKAFGVTNYDYVSGSNWAVSDTTQTLANKIADAIGGRAVHVDCKDVETPGG
jgi:hypothetical protein